MYKSMQAIKEPRYEVGEHKGAQFCAPCHREAYDQWSRNSRHAVATTNKNFLKTRDDVKKSFMLNFMMGEESCYACHGSKEADEGVDCETCHGLVIPDVPIMETHEKKYKPGRSMLKEPDFCAKCHELEPPLMSPYSDWQKSQAAEDGITCQGCHMAPRSGVHTYHGFDSVMHDVGIYRGDLVIKDIKFDLPRFSLTVENRIKGHGVPAGGPSRVLVLEISFMDQEGAVLQRVAEKFYKKFKLMPLVGGMPTNELIEDTQLKSSEARPLSYTLRPPVKDKVKRALVTLRFYDVSDEYQGDIEKAHWVSEPIIEEEVGL
jgi:hypothetical protein